MEQHPIPQDVTGFQFKLIGSMTVKQFGYVATGAILAVISYYVPAPQLWILFMKFILVPLFGLSGVIIAFVPIEGRPIDVMTTNFIRALTSPNQHIYIKKGRVFSFTQNTYTKITSASPTASKTANQVKRGIENIKEQRLQALLSGHHDTIKNDLDQKETAFLTAIKNISTSSTALIPQIAQKQENLRGIASSPQQQINNLQPIPQIPRLDEVHIRNTPPNITKNTGHYMSDTPNVIVGIIKDARGNMLPNILIEVKDKDAVTVRAFKTNSLGQFASATPLANGNYTIEFEDPKKLHAFDVIQINVNGQIMFPIEIVSHDAREELRKALFN